MKKRIIGIVALLLVMLLLPIQSFVHTGIDEEQKINVTIQYEFPGSAFALYRIAAFSKTGEFAITDSFAAYPIELEELDSEGWRNAAEAYAGYVARDQMEATATGITDEDGQLVFSQLENGIYLVVGETKITEERIKYDVMPFMISLPTLTEADTWDYEPIVIPKFEVEELPELINVEVIKLWKNDSTNERPRQIIVQLLANGEVQDEAVLSASNGWSYQWENLEPELEWTVIEKEVPSGYTVQVEHSEETFTITNTGTKQASGIQNLPQTGQLWWPVPLLAIMGAILLIAGAWCGKRRL